jgi:copper(I)-binding protein
MTRETPPGTSVGAGYLTITNKGKEPDKLVTLSSKFSDNVQIHEMKMKNNIMSMKQIKAGLIIPAGETVTLQPGGTHLMFMNLQHQLIEGKVMSVTLNFEKAGTIEVKFPVKKARSHKH